MAALWEPETLAEGFRRLTWEIEPGQGGVTTLTLTHELEGAPRTAAQVSGQIKEAGGGWSFILSDLKTLLETGKPFEGLSSNPNGGAGDPAPPHGDSTRMHSRQELADDFRALGIAPGDTVMLHASVRAVGEIAGGPDQIHLALKDALTAEGTLMMYASCPEYYDEIGRGNLTR